MSTQRTVLVEYFMGPDVTLVFGVREDFAEPRVVRVKISLEETREFVRANFGKDKTMFMDWAEFQALFGALIEPIRLWADEGDTIWIVAHDVLHHLPLHALRIDGRYLIERNPVCYTPSASIMKFCRTNRKGKHESALILGDSRSNLPHAREEARAVARLFNTDPYLTERATKSLLVDALKNTSEGFDLVHFACHGSFRFDQPLQSGIELASENGDADDADTMNASNLTAEEIFGLSIPADIVTVSSCESGVNVNRPGDELIGLTRAFIYAGAASVIVSLWQVADVSTRFLMERFYQELKRGTKKVEALQQAQVYVMNMTKDSPAKAIPAAPRGRAPSSSDLIITETTIEDFSHPYFWAPFILVGDWG